MVRTGGWVVRAGAATDVPGRGAVTQLHASRRIAGPAAVDREPARTPSRGGGRTPALRPGHPDGGPDRGRRGAGRVRGRDPRGAPAGGDPLRRLGGRRAI